MSQDNNNNHDGIIQQVFNKVIQDKTRIYNNEFQEHELILTLGQVKQLQQELIEKIKQEYPLDSKKEITTTYYRLRKKLIGDTQQ